MVTKTFSEMRHIVLLLPVFLFAVTGTVNGCPSGCSCYRSSEFVKVNCSGTRLTHTDLNYPLDTTEIDLSNNPITNLGEKGFKSKLPNVKTLILDSCQISTLSSGLIKSIFPNLHKLSISNNKVKLTVPAAIFEGTVVKELFLSNSGVTDVSFLKNLSPYLLDLSGNKFDVEDLLQHGSQLHQVTDLRLRNLDILDLDVDFLKDFHKLEKLDLANNSIVMILGTVFSHTRQLSYLNVAHNGLAYIQDFGFNLPHVKELKLDHNQLMDISGVFNDMDALKTLDLSHNMIQMVPESYKNLFNQLDELDLNENPFHCNCEMKWFQEWLQEGANANVAKDCKTPKDLPILSLTTADFKCTEPTIGSISSEILTPEGEKILLVCIGYGDPAPQLMWQFRGQELLAVNPSEDRTNPKVISTLAIDNVTPDTNMGLYTCIANNVMGKTNDSVMVRVIPLDEWSTYFDMTTMAAVHGGDGGDSGGDNDKQEGFKKEHIAVMGVVGVLVLFILVALVLITMIYRKRKYEKEYVVSGHGVSCDKIYISTETLGSGQVAV